LACSISVVGVEHKQAGVGVATGRGGPEQRRPPYGVGQWRGERRHQPGLGLGEPGTASLAQQGERAPRTRGAGQDEPQLVAETARPAELAVASAPVQLTRGGLREAGRRPPAGQGRELVDVRLAQLDLGEPDRRAPGQAVLDEVARR
jgi:hypothetical protein